VAFDYTSQSKYQYRIRFQCHQRLLNKASSWSELRSHFHSPGGFISSAARQAPVVVEANAHDVILIQESVGMSH
jgi:hypothetical protein